MEIEIDISDQIKEREKRKSRFGKYEVAIKPYIPWIKEQINQNKNKAISMKTFDIANQIGIKKSPNAIYWGLKYVLFYEGIFVSSGYSKEGDPMLIMRMKTEKDELPLSLRDKDKDKNKEIELEEEKSKFEILEIY